MKPPLINQPNDKQSIKSRRIYYFGGFDPRGAGHYHKLFGTQAKKTQDEKVNIRIGRRKRSGDFTNSWQVSYERIDSESKTSEIIHTKHVIMGWDDIIRSHWIKSPFEIIYSFFSIYSQPQSWSALNRARKIFFPAYFSGIFPFVFFTSYFLIIFLYFLSIKKISENSVYYYFFSISSLTVNVFSPVALTYIFYVLAKRTGVLWLLRIFRFNIIFSKNIIEALEIRQKEWVEKIIIQQIQDPVDELIFSAHSVGTLLLVGVIDDLLADDRWIEINPQKNTQLLTLGQCYPFITLMPSATRFRMALQRICKSDRILWLDVTARIDPLCFYGIHPLQDSGVDIRIYSQPIPYKARFFKMYSPDQWKKIKKNKILVHFLYLMAPEKSGGFNIYDFFYGTGNFENKVTLLIHARNKD
jgi:hypothetical protein